MHSFNQRFRGLRQESGRVGYVSLPVSFVAAEFQVFLDEMQAFQQDKCH